MTSNLINIYIYLSTRGRVKQTILAYIEIFAIILELLILFHSLIKQDSVLSELPMKLPYFQKLFLKIDSWKKFKYRVVFSIHRVSCACLPWYHPFCDGCVSYIVDCRFVFLGCYTYIYMSKVQPELEWVEIMLWLTIFECWEANIIGKCFLSGGCMM